MRATQLFLLLLGIGAAGYASGSDVSAIYGRYSPTGAVRQSQPRVSWKLTPTGGGTVSRVEMLINDAPVRAEFQAATAEVVHVPEAPMEPGLHLVECRVTIDRAVTVRQEWCFEVGARDEVDASGSAGYAARYALEATNEIRANLSMPAFILNAEMSKAAAAHSRYQVLNRSIGHFEEPGKKGFTGKAPWDRTAKAGYGGLCYEGVCGNQTDPRKAVRLLFDAPYHRIAFLQPGAPSIGIGYEAGVLTVNYGVSDIEGAGMAPAPGQSGVPVQWDGNESPSPLRIHNASGPVGYPIVFAWFSERLEGIEVQSMRLASAEGSVPAYVNTPENDRQLRFAAVVIPRRPLRPFTKYTVQVRATTKNGVRVDRTWSFTTGS